MLSKFSERFKQLRKERGLSYESLETDLGISRSTMCRWENKQTDVKSEELIKVSQFFGVTVHFLLGLED
ncbi:MAG: helix-turn-helix transcriptional regulator [Clostridia bacterium]|nr:helix-turn-helix transcriptional regulator [Clostridia bacterium]